MNREFKKFWHMVKRFFEPALSIKWATVRAIFWHFVLNISWPINAVFIWIIWSALEGGNKIIIFRRIIVYSILLCTNHIVMDIIRKRWRPQTYYQQMRHIQDKYLPKYLQIDWNYLDRLWTWKLISIMSNWFEKRTSLITDTTWAIVSFFVAFLSWFYFSWKLWIWFVLWYLILFVSISIISVLIDRPSRKLREKRRDSMNDYSRALVRFIMSRVDIIQNNKIKHEIKNTWLHIDKAGNYVLQQATPLSRMFNIPKSLISVFRIIVVSFWSLLYLKWKIWIWEFSAMLWFMLLIDWVITEFVRSYKNFTKDFNVVEKLWDVFDNAPKWRDFFLWSNFTYKSWNIEIQNLGFSYDKSPIFQNFYLDIKGWTKTAFVGESWGGKTTLVKLLAWYIRPDSGGIKVDWQKLSEIKLTDYYKHVGYLTQDPSVFDGTIYENIVYSLNYNPKKEELEKVIKLAKCDFVREFEKWLDTEIGERWVRLSWWQKQRLAIAKIMLKNPNIILLDEPTSALDSFNEEQISIALHNLFKGKTVIVVAHRLQTVKQADRILLLEQGKILEEWTHNELVKINGKYKKMLDLQSWF